ILESLALDYPAGEAALREEMTTRGVLPGCARVLEYTGSPVNPPAQSPYQAFVAPGREWFRFAERLAPGMIQVHATIPAGTEKIVVGVKDSFSLHDRGGDDEFSPQVLVSFGAPITWQRTGRLQHDAPIERAATLGQEVEVAVPLGATDVFVQIANGG